GTDTCIRIGGEVEFRVLFDESDEFHNSSNWQFRTSFDLNVTTKSMTDWGPLTTFVNLTGGSADYKDSDDPSVYADEFYLSLGPVLLGRTGSNFDIVGGGYTWNIGSTSVADLTDHKVDQVQLSWAINGFGLVLALERPQDRWGSSASEDLPDLVAALSSSGSGWDASVAFIYSDQEADSLWGVQGNLEIEVWGDQLQLGALFADDGSSGDSESDFLTEDGWAVLVSYQHNWSSNLYSAITFQYWEDDNPGAPPDGWNAQFTTAFSPASGLWVGADAGYNDAVDNWVFSLFAEREFGG
ncbi:MAG: porin, partial [bacterium]